MVHEDCLGIDCDVTINKGLLRGKIDLTLNVYPDEKRVTLTADGEQQVVSVSSFQCALL